MSRSEKPKSTAVGKGQSIRVRPRKKGDPVYEVRYRDPSTLDTRGYPLVRGKTFKTLEEAKDWQANVRIEQKQGKFISPDRGKKPWGEIANDYLEMRTDLKARTLHGYHNIVKVWLSEWEHRRIDSLTPADVLAVITRMKNAKDKDGKPKPRAAQTQHRVFNLMTSVFTYAVDLRYISLNPTSGLRKHLPSITKGPRFKGRALTPNEATRIINALPEGRFRLYALLGYYSGFRAGELAGLRVRNLDPLRNTVQVGETVEDIAGRLRPGTPKTEQSKDRIVDVPPAVMKQLTDYIGQAGLEPDDYVFAGPKPFFSHKTYSKKEWKAACKTAELEGTRFHDLRVTFASLRAREGMPPHKLRRLLGHSSIDTTMNVYVQVFGGDPEDKKFAERIYEMTESGEAISDGDVQKLRDDEAV